MSKDGGALPAGDVVKMYVTCLGGSDAAAATKLSAAADMTTPVPATS
jgi:hypothetical protein